jgi:hypothetical protein
MVEEFEDLYEQLGSSRFRRTFPLQPYWRLLAPLAAKHGTPALP